MDVFQVLDECPACRVESARAALYDPEAPACLLGLAIESRCRLCGRRTRGAVIPDLAPLRDGGARMRREHCPACDTPLGENERLTCHCEACGIRAEERIVDPGQRFAHPGELMQALQRWAREEGHDSVDTFFESSFLDPDPRAVFAKLRAGEPVETNFDVLAFLFPEIAMAASVPPDAPAPREPAAAPPAPASAGGPVPAVSPSPDGVSPAPPAGPAPEHHRAEVDPAPPDDDPACAESGALDSTERHAAWAPLLPLVSVMVADGRVHPAEEAFLQRFLSQHRCPPIPAEFVRVHRPETLPRPPTAEQRERLLEAMVHLVHVDRSRDGSEVRVVEEYARCWGVDPARVAHWDQVYRDRYAAGVQRLWLVMQKVFTRKS